MKLFQQWRNMIIARSSLDHASWCIDDGLEADRAGMQAIQQEHRCSDPVVTTSPTSDLRLTEQRML